MIKNLACSKPVFALFLCFAVLFACTSPVWAQTASTGALTGTITDPSGGVIVGATVELTSRATGQGRTTTSDSAGTYIFSLLQPGNYSVKVSAVGFKTAQVDSVTVSVLWSPATIRRSSICLLVW